MVWEKELGHRLRNADAELRKDIDKLRRNTQAAEQVCSEDNGRDMEDVIGKVPGKKDILRATVVQEISRMRNGKANVVALAEDAAELKSLLDEADREHEELEEEIESLSRYAETDSKVKIAKFLTAGKEINAILSGLCGITPVRVAPTQVVVNVGGYIQVSFSLHEEKVINVSCKTVLCASGSVHLQKYMEGVLNVANEMSEVRQVKYARNIGRTLKRMSMYVLKANAMYEDVEVLLRRKLGRIDSIGRVQGDKNGIEIRATLECFCVRRGAKFDVSAVGRTTLLEGYRVRQFVEMTELNRWCGSEPSDADIVNALRCGSTRIPGLVSLAGGFEGIRTMLNERPQIR